MLFYKPKRMKDRLTDFVWGLREVFTEEVMLQQNLEVGQQFPRQRRVRGCPK